MKGKEQLLCFLDLIINGNWDELEKVNKFNKNVGFCANLNYFLFAPPTRAKSSFWFERAFYTYLPTYSLYSNNIEFPIPHDIIEPQEAYNRFEKWDYDTVYGMNRRLMVKEFKDFLLRTNFL